MTEEHQDIMPEPPEHPKPPEDAVGFEAGQLEAIIKKLEETETDLGLKYVGQDPGKGMNRSERRAADRTIKRVTRRPAACKTLKHPLLDTLTPYGAKRLKQRRARNRMARASRRVNREAA